MKASAPGVASLADSELLQTSPDVDQMLLYVVEYCKYTCAEDTLLHDSQTT